MKFTRGKYLFTSYLATNTYTLRLLDVVVSQLLLHNMHCLGCLIKVRLCKKKKKKKLFLGPVFCTKCQGQANSDMLKVRACVHVFFQLFPMTKERMRLNVVDECYAFITLAIVSLFLFLSSTLC